jgi:hypothetical protein
MPPKIHDSGQSPRIQSLALSHFLNLQIIFISSQLGTARKIQLFMPLKARRTHIQRGSHEVYAHFLPTIFGEDPRILSIILRIIRIITHNMSVNLELIMLELLFHQ